MFKTIGRNIAASWIGYGVQVLVTFFLTPYVVRTLGDARYGAWTVIIGLTGYYGLLDLGFRAGLTQSMARFLALKDFRRLNETASTGCTSLSLIGAVLLVVTAGVAAGAPYFFDLPTDQVTEVRWSIVFMGMGVAVQFPFFCFSAALTAAQRYDVSNAIGVTTRLISAVLTVTSLASGYGLIGISLATLTGNLVDYGLRWNAAHRVIPELQIRVGGFHFMTFRDFLTFGIWNTVIAGSRRLLTYGSTLIIAVFLPVAAATPFALAASVADHLNRILMPAGAVFFPAAAQLDAKGDRKQLQLLYLSGSRLLFTVSIGIGLIAMMWADDFFQAWLGASSINEFGSAASICKWLLAATIASSGQRVGYQILLGAREVRVLAVLFLIESLSTVILSSVFIQFWGLLGVSVASVVPGAVMQLIVHPLVLCRFLQLAPSNYFLSIYPRLALFAATCGGGLFIMRRSMPSGNLSWTQLACQGAAASSMVCAMSLLIAASSHERASILGPLRSRLAGYRDSIRRRLIGSGRRISKAGEVESTDFESVHDGGHLAESMSIEKA